jgi:lipopolysaccharide transport system ATP-binding protein
MNDIALEVRDLGKNYPVYEKNYHPLLDALFHGHRKFHREFCALSGVSFVVKKGETVGIIGRNGSGKSTLLQMICGTVTPTQGTVTVSGRVAALLELGAGFNPQFTGRENVLFNGALLGFSRAELLDRFDEIARFADIGDFVDQPVKTYSSGMMVRLAFATAIHVSPDILVVDEALAVGDTAFQAKCLDRIRRMQKEGVSILLVTHSNNTIIEYCDRALYLRRGQLAGEGASRNVVSQYVDDLVADSREAGMNTLPLATTARASSIVGESVGDSTGSSSIPAFEILECQLVDQQGQSRGAFRYGERVHLRAVLDCRRPVAAPCFGIQIKSVDGISLWAGTTRQLGLNFGAILTLGRYELEWSLELGFCGNRYVLAIGAGEIIDGEYRRSARLDYAGHFDVLPQPKAGAGWLSPFPEVTLHAA